MLRDSIYDKSEIYDYIFENTGCIPVIETNKRRGIRSDRLTVNRNRSQEGICFSIFFKIGNIKNIFHIGADHAIDLKSLYTI